MCGRFTLRTSAAEVAKAFELPLFDTSQIEWTPRYNIAPTLSILTLPVNPLANSPRHAAPDCIEPRA
jgi:putative SOS response-associated peptidase YedK